MDMTLTIFAIGGATAAMSAPALRSRLELSLAKHRSLAGHPRIARRVAALVPFYQYDEERFFDADGAPAFVVERRRAGFERLSCSIASASPKPRD
jgi:glutamate-1-semialdehyde 2,1-aminomutase